VRLGGDPAGWAEEIEGAWRRLDAAPWRGGRATGERVALGACPLRAPVEPTKIVCVGLNYAQHVAESATRDTPPEEPLLFLKPVSALTDPEAPIVLPPVGRVDHEAEVALVIGQRLSHGDTNAARRAIFGVTALNDVTARELQRRDGQWTRAKGFDTFCPVGPRLVTGLDADRLALCARVNGETRQRGTTRDFLFPSAELVAFISGVMTLEPGDVVSTGTPAGVGPLADGDRVEIEVEGVGVLANPVRRAIV
jgi:2-keto-4-pentenoate hydratase/2-oxohepta-3-ene-1,7-dioic acid hydratase in catechol pathway